MMKLCVFLYAEPSSCFVSFYISVQKADKHSLANALPSSICVSFHFSVLKAQKHSLANALTMHNSRQH